jgi:hypothetical protein
VTVMLAGPQPGGFASLVADLLEQNLMRDPGRRKLLQPSVVVLEAPDADVVVHLRIGADAVRVGDGDVPDAHLRVAAEADRLIGLTRVPLRFGLPDAVKPEGRAVLGDLLGRRLRIRGLIRHPVRLARLTRLLSVADPGSAP